MKMEKNIGWIRDLTGALQVVPTGSRYIGGHTDDSDYDYILWVSDLNVVATLLKDRGWDVNQDDEEYRHEYNGEIKFHTARKGVYNLIVYEDFEGFRLMRLATEMAKKLNATDRKLRVELFQAIMEARIHTVGVEDVG